MGSSYPFTEANGTLGFNPVAASGIASLPLTPIVGRSRDIDEITELLAQPASRLVVLTGPGGIGKTRLATEVARVSSHLFPDGVTLVSLAPVRDPDELLSAIAAAIDLRDIGVRPVPELLVTLLRDHNRLLVLDNFEQIVTAAPRLVELLTECPGLKILVTSRTVLRVTGEFVYPVPPLPWVDHTHSPDAVRLFFDRARAVVPEFTLDGETLPLVTAVCQRLDGLPLAIELAAVHLRYFPLNELRKRLDQQLALLSGGPRDQPDRLQTMRNAIAWSYELLGEEDQALFRRLSVFPGGFRLDAAAWVYGENDESAVLSGIATLIDSSMLSQAPEADGTPRYRMLEVIREFGLEQLDRHDESTISHQRMAEWCLDLVVRGRPIIQRRSNDLPWLRRYDEELDNFRSVLAWLEADGQAEQMVRLASCLGWYWYSRTLLREGQSWLNRGLTAAREQSIDRTEHATAKFWLGVVTHFQGDQDLARRIVGSAQSQFRDLMDDEHYSAATLILGTIEVHAGNPELALEYLEDALALMRHDHVHEPAMEVLTMYHIAMARRVLGDLDEATEIVTRAYELAESMDDHWGMATCLLGLGLCSFDNDEFEQAASQLQRSLRESLIIASPFTGAAVGAIAAIATLMVSCSQPERATRLFAVEHRLRSLISTPRKQQLRLWHESSEERARDMLGDRAFWTAWSEGEQMGLEEALELIWTFDAAESGRIASPSPTDQAGLRDDQLTPREMEILKLVADGLTNPEIAEHLFIGRGTVRTHVSSILGKTGARTRTEAVKLARSRGLLDAS